MKFRMPHIFIVLFCMIIFAGIITWFIPAGEYQRTEGVNGRIVIVSDTFQVVTSHPAGVMDILSAVPRGLVDAAVVVFAVLIVGGAFGVIHATKTIDIGLNRFTQAFKGKELFMIPIIMTVFALIASFIGTPELSLIYIPIILALCKSIKWDPLVAVAITLLGVTAGFSTALISPFSVGIAQQLAEIQVGSGIGYRIIIFLAILITGVLYILQYVRKITRNPELGLINENDEDTGNANQDVKLKTNYRHALTGIILLGGLAIIVYGIINHGWYLLEMSAVFISMVILIGILNRMNVDTVAKEFVNGCQSVLVGALVVGFARGIALLLEDGQVMDTIIYALSSVVEGLPSGVTAVGMLGVQTILNFVVPSSSGQAVIAMPIMIPLADIVGVTRQTAILAFQLGDGLSGVFFPTSGFFMATLAMAGVPYQKWVKFFAPLLGIWLLIGGIALFIAHSFGWQ